MAAPRVWISFCVCVYLFFSHLSLLKNVILVRYILIWLKPLLRSLKYTCERKTKLSQSCIFQRNPDILLYGLPWAWPGWISGGSQNPWDRPDQAAKYILKWIQGAKKHYNLTIDIIGVRCSLFSPFNFYFERYWKHFICRFGMKKHIPQVMSSCWGKFWTRMDFHTSE